MKQRKPDVFLPPIIVEKHDIHTLSQTVDWANTYHKAADWYGKSRGENALVFVLDTAGTFKDHQDLSANNDVRLNYNATQFPDKDMHGHGTHCAGIAAATDNSFGVIGIAPAAKLGAVKVLGDNGSGYSNDIAEGIRWVADLELPSEYAGRQKIISGSLGGRSRMPNVEEAIDYAISKGVWVIFAAGNSGFNSTSTVLYPAKYKPVIAVGSIRKNEERSSFSSGGPELDVAAYGDGNYSTYKNNTYATLRGTSMACPVVAGIAALLAGEFDWLEDQDDLMNAFRKYAKDLFEDGFDHRTGHGALIMDLFDNEPPPPPNDDDDDDTPEEPDEPTVPSYWQELWLDDVFTLRAKRIDETEYSDLKVKITPFAKVDGDAKIREALSFTAAFFERRAIVHREEAIARDFLSAVKLFFDMIVSRKSGIMVQAKEVSVDWKGATITQSFELKETELVRTVTEIGSRTLINGIETFIIQSPNHTTMEKFGIEAIEAGIDTADSLVELYKATYLDDKKITAEDLADLIKIGPGLATDLMKFTREVGDLPKEWDDLSDEELDTVYAKIDEVVDDVNLQQAIKSLLQLSVSIDRYAESKQGKQDGRTSR